MKGAGYGVIGDIILGILGAVIGGFIMRQIGFAGQGGLIYTILVAARRRRGSHGDRSSLEASLTSSRALLRVRSVDYPPSACILMACLTTHIS